MPEIQFKETVTSVAAENKSATKDPRALKIFDPLGLIALVMLVGKLIMQPMVGWNRVGLAHSDRDAARCLRVNEVVLQSLLGDVEEDKPTATYLPKRPQPTITSASRTVKRSGRNFTYPSLIDHFTGEADSQGESVETARDSDSDSETEVVLRAAASPVVPVGGQQLIVPSRHIKQPQKQAMEAIRKFISSVIFRKRSEEDVHQ
ncbi:hypothetical protein OUZ56_021896 [Daphnia magna]|uniref:Uncharacterized protein n=1 Tax=Daphnia magna TaxID=35525 RepID=A0ABR0AVA7_9CRUS|nr:hypothetical protein OUZ56_021896 [Daphnia magna]